MSNKYLLFKENQYGIGAHYFLTSKFFTKKGFFDVYGYFELTFWEWKAPPNGYEQKIFKKRIRSFSLDSPGQHRLHQILIKSFPIDQFDESVYNQYLSGINSSIFQIVSDLQKQIEGYFIND